MTITAATTKLEASGPFSLIHNILERRAVAAADDPALYSPDHPALSFAQAHSATASTIQALQNLGLRRGARIAAVLPNGPEAVISFLAVSAIGAYAPLNPAYREQELEFYLRDLQPHALLFSPDCDSPARTLATALGIPVIEVGRVNEHSLTLRGQAPESRGHKPEYAQSGDDALLLYTSGTTARPKLVPLTHANILTAVQANCRALELTPVDRCLNVMPLFHIHGLVAATLTALAAGSSVACCPEFNPNRVSGWFNAFQPTWYSASATIHRDILNRIDRRNPLRAKLRFIRVGSTAISPELIQRLEQTFAAPVIEAYGMTEAGPLIASNPLPPRKRKRGSAGLATGPQVTILDEYGRCLEPDSDGEIAIKGANVTRGYLNNPEANADAFANGWFRTGDLGRIDRDGYIFITGRKKEQINRAGEKISPREVEACLLRHRAVSEAVVFGVPEPRLGEEIAAVIVPHVNMAVTERELHEHCVQLLAPFKIPRRILLLDELPREAYGASGKLQRSRLAELLNVRFEATDASPPAEFVTPETPAEQRLALLWSEILDVERVGANDNFFALGGNSILGARLLARVRDQTHVALSIVALFAEASTLRGMARCIEAQPRQPAYSSEAAAAVDPLQPTHAQERLWFIDRLQPGTPLYNLKRVMRVYGPLETASLQQALTRIVARHTTLRTVFDAANGRPVPRILPPADFALKCVDLRHIEDSERETLAVRLITQECARPFDLSRDVMLRASLYHLGDNEQVLALTLHHIAGDAWSWNVLLQELAANYAALQAGNEPRSAPLTANYFELAAEEREWAHSAVAQASLSFWRTKLADLPESMALPTNSSAPDSASVCGRTRVFTLNRETTARLRAFSREHNVTVFMTLLAAFKTLLYRYSGQDDLAVGVPVAARNTTASEALIGLFVNTLVLRDDLSGAPSFAELIQRIRRTTVEALAHQRTPLDTLVAELCPTRRLGRNPLFQVMVDLRNVAAAPHAIGELNTQPLWIDNGTALFDLTLTFVESDSQMDGYLEYKTNAFSPATIERVVQHFTNLLDAALTDPSQSLDRLPLLSTIEQHELLEHSSARAITFPHNLCVHALIQQQAEQSPGRIAVICNEQELSYGELEARANQLARYLRLNGVRPDTRVAICLDRSPEMIVCILATLKAGGAYVPLDPQAPLERLRFILDETDACVVVTHSNFDAFFNGVRAPVVYVDQNWSAVKHQISTPFNSDVTFDHDAYVLYTSGSTGQPKGVVVTHGNLANAYWAWEATYHLRGNIKSVLQAASYTFDVFSGDFVRALCSGSTLSLCPRDHLLLPELLYATLAKHSIALFETVPAVLRQLSAWMEHTHVTLPALKLLISGSDTLFASEYERLRKLFTSARVLNTYGVTEATIDSTYFNGPVNSTAHDALTPIGVPFPNTRIYVLNAALQPQPLGVTGELFIGGPGVSRGYLNRPELTARHFLPDPFCPGDRMYRTGDLARFRSDGQLEFLGRRDTQVKIRGFRVEIGEIEAMLRRHADIVETVVLAKDFSGGKQLVAFVVPKASDLDLTSVRAWLKSRLPKYMLPAQIHTLEALPLSANGKVDRKQLDARPIAEPERQRECVAPSNELERQILAIWQQTLGLSSISMHDNFFEIGGHSLLAATLIHALRASFHCDVTLRALFESPTIAGLATWISDCSGTESMLDPQPAAILHANPSERYEPFSLTDVQEAYWVGRSAAFELGNVACHSYKEVDIDDLDVTRLEAALQKLLARHDMLRAIVRPDGLQQILAELPLVEIPIRDLRTLSEAQRNEQLLAIRAELTQQTLPLTRAPMLQLSTTRLSERRTRLHFCIDGLISDALSDRILMGELHTLYRDPQASLPPLKLTFRDYVLHERSDERAKLFEQSRDYWLKKIPELPPPPDVPLAKNPAAVVMPEFVRRTTRLNRQTWQAFKGNCAPHGVTPSTGLLLAYAQVLRTWSTKARFALNLTLYNRAPVHADVDKIIGNFTSLSMFAIDLTERNSFAEHARRLQEELWEDLDHRHFSGIQVLRELARANGSVAAAQMPVVFTSVLELSRMQHAQASWKLFGDVVWGKNQTPQVWLDNQVIDDNGELVINWDAVEELFPARMLDDMFAAYRRVIEHLATSPENWHQATLDLLPEYQLQQLATVNATTWPVPDGLLHEPVFAQVAQRPHAPAVISSGLTLSYAALGRHAHELAGQLQRDRVAPNELVAVVMEKSWAQVAAVLGILRSGAAYLPVDASLPPERIQFLIDDGGVRHVVTTPELAQQLTSPAGIQRHILTSEVPVSTAALPRALQAPSDLAYVIYTSGSTGKPKGVMLDHRAVLNTIVDINQRFGLTENDRVLALSALSFDLSVYDIFGLLAAGGAIVIPEAKKFREPSHWAELLRLHAVTVWNSVPAFLEMFVQYCAGTQQPAFDALRLILLSGDWIPVGLPEKVRRFAPHARIVALGGATEAAIWSIFYPIEEVDPAWKSIPYGKPLKNQSFFVLNEQLGLCPHWVTGQLYIGGVGLAQGYWNNPEKTQSCFIRHPGTGERLYKTGDLGRYLPDGNIEFLGRSDHQVKLRGFRIELGEIEAALNQHPAVRDSVVTVHDDHDGKRRLVAYMTIKMCDGTQTPKPNELSAYLRRSLPEYMIPHAFITLDALPLSANGKVDRRSLPAPVLPDGQTQARVPARTPTEAFVADTWQRVLKLESIGIHENFFDLGGDSIHAIQVLSEIQREYQIDLNLFTLFEAPTIAGLSDLITQKQVEMTDQVELAQILGDIEALAAENATTGVSSNSVLEHHLDLDTGSNESAQGSNFETDS